MAIEFRQAVDNDVEVKEKYKESDSMSSVLDIIDIIFSMTIAIMMFLCFFSLTTSMSANLYD